MSKIENDLEKLCNESGIPKSTIYDAYNKYYSSSPTSRTVRQKDIGYCSRLIIEMTAKDATEDEFERAILYSIVVIDCVKKKLSTTKAYEDLNIRELYDKYIKGIKED